MKIRKIKKKSKILVKAKIIAQQVINNQEEYRELSIQDLQIRTNYLIEGLQNNKFTLDDIVVDAFSIAREIIYRVYGMQAYEVQMMGAYVVHSGDFAEMYTGEGKSLTILLVAFLNALSKKGVHIVTVNEYLVERDAEFAGKAFEQLGITVGYNTSKLSKEVKKEMFARDITYTTNSELGFDYLKDNMVRSMEEKVIRGLNFVIIDEADSVLIDEARTPLIISGQPKEDFSLYLDIDKFVSKLTKDDYKIDNESNTISLTDSGVSKAESYFKVSNLYSVESAEIVHKLTNALIAHFIFANGKEYLVKDDKIYLVDQFTGRVLEGRSYNAGLQQAIQAKERVQIEPENVVMATITYQSFFRLYEKLSGVSGTAMTEAEEFLKIYNMVVVRVPTNRPIIRIDKQDYIFGTKKVKWNHVIAEIVNRHQTGQPILVGTSSVTDSEIIHERLTELNIPHEVLNARDNSKEAEIVKHAGERGAITISTNMAGRGTDIKVSDEIKAIGGLYVIGTERHESRRIDNQLRGRTGRQGDPGESRFFTSLEDSLFKRFATDKFKKASEKLEEEFYDSKFFSRMLDNTQKKVEGLNFDIRKNLMDYDHVLSLQRELIYKQRDQILLKTNNYDIVNNMANDYASIFIEEYKNKENTALVDAPKMTKFLNEKILKFPFFDVSTFENQAITTAVDKFLLILKEVIKIKYNILTEISATNVIDEILLVNLDQYWTKHIDKMTKLREGVNLRSLEQRSPLNIYIEDGNNLFEKMKSDIVHSVINQICELSLPNEQEKVREALEQLVSTEEFKKKQYDDLQQTADLNLTNNDIDNEFNDNDEIILNGDVSNNYSLEDFIKNKNEEEEEDFDTVIKRVEKTIDNYDVTENIEVEKLEEIIETTENKHAVNKENEQEVLENVITESELFNNNTEWTDVENIFNPKPEEKNETKPINENLEEQKNEVQADIEQENIVEKEIENKTIENIETIEKEDVIVDEPIQTNVVEDIVEEQEETKNFVNDISDDEIEKILNMPAFKDGEQSLSLNQFLDNVLGSMDIDEDYEMIEVNDIENIKTTIEPTKAQLKQQELQEIRDEIKHVIAKNTFGRDEFKKYRQGFFQDGENKIDYSKYKETVQAANKETNNDYVIKEFYKTPYVQKRKPGTLFGIPMTKYDKDIKNVSTFDEYIKLKEEKAATQEQLNNLLFVDDERNRLKKIEKKFSKITEDEIFQKKLEKEIAREPSIENNNLYQSTNNKLIDLHNVSNVNHEFGLDNSLNINITLVDEDPVTISSILTKKRDSIPFDEKLIQYPSVSDSYEEELEQEHGSFVENVYFEDDSNTNNLPVVSKKHQDLKVIPDKSFLHNETNSKQQEIKEDHMLNKPFIDENDNVVLKSNNALVIDYSYKSSNNNHQDKNDPSSFVNQLEYAEEVMRSNNQSMIDEYIDKNFIEKFTFKRFVNDEYESEIISEIRKKNSMAIQEPISSRNFDKEIIEILEKKAIEASKN